ncbi:hypothetical protein PV08_05008 [Exophiala spinifera]|uniref:YTH domain-containing protein n=1 Tax=Exophiala spinifera TaxID=91928 RepID=A0A0D2BFM8_9EURO|nr:uncharacterized protein PV08_05008 [Exophiala spinifera]KIW17813.1 hypothetical protein PV08_05008 [Exophiala spinifera]
MGDEPPPRHNLASNEHQDDLRGSLSYEAFSVILTNDSTPDPPLQQTISSPPKVAQFNNMEAEQYPRQPFSMGHVPGAGALDMSGMSGALPDPQLRQYHQHSYPHQFQSPALTGQVMYQYNQGAQFAGQIAGNYTPQPGQQYPMQFMTSTPPRQPHVGYTQYMSGQGGSQQFQQQGQGYLMQQSMIPQSTAQHQQQVTYSQAFTNPAYATAYATRMTAVYPVPQLRVDSSLTQSPQHGFYQHHHDQAIRRTSSNSSLQTSALRGPPRKPRQSGHALWVGNLPPSTHIIDLKDHFSKDATEDIESVFLISKSNCAFVNYKSEASCAAAMARFHDSRFQGVRLVCRLRRGSSSVTTQGLPQGQIAAVRSDESSSSQSKQEAPVVQDVTTEGATVSSEPESIERVKEKFFVVKSLTVEDLERSVHSGVWATQAHNEASLNSAYMSAESVYLIFSANKSGEYFGYARMESAIDEESAAAIDYQPRAETRDPSPSDLPLTIPTPATATAPKGRIIDDSARGTIFWEAESALSGQEEQNADDDANASGEGYESASPSTPQTFGKPFKIKWMSTDKLPFYRTRGLRNPWNSNREVKIARDGTQIEPSVGRKLIDMFHRPPMAATSSPNTSRQHPPAGSQGGFMSPHSPAAGGMYGRPY